MRRARKRPMNGIAFGWEHVSEKAPIGFMGSRACQAADLTMVTDQSEAHALVIAETGGGKGRNLLIPTLLESHGNIIVVDPKGEAAMVTARYRRSLGQEVYILDPFHVISDRTDTFNPLDLVSRDPDARVEDGAEVAATIVGERSLKDPFWDNWALSLVGAMVSAVVATEPEEANLGRVWKKFHGDDTTYNLAVMLDTVGSQLDEVAHGHIAAFLQLSERETRPSVLGTVQQHVRLFGNPLVKAAMNTTSFDLAALQDGRPLTIYLVIPPNKIRSHSPMLRMWLWAILTAMVNRPTNPETPTLFLIDEFAHIGAFPLLEDCVTLMRGYGVRLVLFLQHVEQLAKLYPKSVNTIVGNCAAVAAFGISNAAMAKPIAELLGDITPEQLIAMAPNELALRLRKQPTRMLTKLDYMTDRHFRGRFDRNARYGPSR